MLRTGTIAGCAAALAACAALGGCAATLPPVPGNGGPAWFELTSEHFVVWTDTSSRRAHELVRDMERLRQVIGGVAFPTGSGAGRIFAIAVRDDDELGQLSREPRAFAVRAGSPLWQPAVVLSAFSNGKSEDETLIHELTHAISSAAIHHQPRWLAEGMAQYFETLQLDVDRTMVDVGVAPQRRGQPRKIAHLVSASTLFAWQGLRESKVEEHLYSTAWALFTYLVNEHRNELQQYLKLVDETDGGPDGAPAGLDVRMWDQAFTSLPFGAVDIELRQWLVRGRHIVMHFELQQREWPTTERTLGDADVHAVRALVRAIAQGEAEAKNSLGAALAIEPTNVLAQLVGRAYFKAKVSASAARATTAAHPDDWRAWWLAAIAISDAQGDAAEARATQAKACKLIAQNPALVAPPNLCPENTRSASP